MILGNQYAEQNIEALGLVGQQVNSASTDLNIGNKIILVTFGGYKSKNKLLPLTPSDPYSQILVDANEWEPTIIHTEVNLDDFDSGIWIRPGVGVLCTTQSTVKLPANVVGQVLLKSSRAREFVQMCVSGYFDNGFEGEGTLALYAPVIPVRLFSGMKISQIILHELKDASFDYSTQPTAKYQGQTGPTASKDAKYD